MNKKVVNTVGYLFAISLSIAVLFFVIACTWIGYEAKNQCKEAQAKFGGNCTQALSARLNDPTQSFKSRNDAIWALGQWGDASALPALRAHYTGIIPDREPYNEVISQYELKKAINLCSGGTNISTFIWRNNQ